MEEKKFVKNNKVNDNKKGNKNSSIGPLKYNLSDQLDKLFPQYKPSKKKEENNKWKHY